MNRTTRLSTPALLLTLALGLTSSATAADSAGHRGPTKSAVVAGKLVRAAAEVLAIDPVSRTVTLRREDGNTLTVIADKRITNLAQVSVGDIVIAQYGHAQAISLKKTAAATGDAAAVAAPSTKGGAQKRSLIADIIAIDDRTGQATLKGGNGAIVDVVFSNRKALKAVRIGDRVKLEYTDAIAISIKPAGQAVSPRRQPSS